MAQIFISYRRAESQDFVYRLRDHLLPHCEEVFVDVHSIPPGENFRKVLEEAVKSSDLVLAVIGKTWSTGGQASAGVTDPQDYVRAELEAALENNVVILPILVQGASMPTSESLPESLGSLPELHALEVGLPPGFERDVDRIIARINEVADVYIRRTVRRHKQLTSGAGPISVKMVTKDGALITSNDGRGFSVLPEYRHIVAEWEASEEYVVVLGLVNASQGELAIVRETLTLDATQFDTDDPDFNDKLEEIRGERGA